MKAPDRIQIETGYFLNEQRPLVELKEGDLVHLSFGSGQRCRTTTYRVERLSTKDYERIPPGKKRAKTIELADGLTLVRYVPKHELTKDVKL